MMKRASIVFWGFDTNAFSFSIHLCLLTPSIPRRGEGKGESKENTISTKTDGGGTL